MAPAGAVPAASCIRRIDIAGLADDARRGCIAAAAQAAEGRLAPAAGVMVQAVWFDAGAQDAGRLLLTIHHLAVDGVSWRILLPDLAAAWAAIARGEEPALPARGTSLRRWAQRLAVEAQDAGRVGELSFWSGMLSAPSLSLVDGALDPARDTAGTAGHLTLTLPASLTGALLTRLPAAFHGGINDVLLSGLVVAVADWCRRRGRGAGRGSGQAVLLDLEGHGREEIFADVDLSRTVGWFTSLFPVRLDPGALDLEEALGGRCRARARGEEHQGAVAGAARQRARLWAAALFERADGFAACGACGAAARLQLSRALRGGGIGGLGGGVRGGAARRRRSCRSPTRSRSMRSRSMMPRGPS